MGFVIQENRTPRWKAWLMALLGMGAAGCMPVHQDYVMLRPAQPAGMMAYAKNGPVMYIVDPAAVADGRFASGDEGTGDSWPLHAQRLPNVAVNLQRCTDHAAAAIRADQGENFNMLRFDTDGLLTKRMDAYMGTQYVGTVQDGEGTWYGRREYRRVSFHCLQDAQGQVVYSFVRPQ